jgi:hypothetical protein
VAVNGLPVTSLAPNPATSPALPATRSHLNAEAQKFLYEKSLDRWIELHTIDFAFPEDEGKPDGDKRSVFKNSAGELDSEIEQWNKKRPGAR